MPFKVGQRTNSPWRRDSIVAKRVKCTCANEGCQRLFWKAPSSCRGESQEGHAMNGLPSTFTTRETAVLRELLTGRKPSDLCRSLGISSANLGDYRKRIFRKLGVASLVELGAYAYQRNWIQVRS